MKQAGIMASKAGIELTESQIYRYVRLRQLMALKSQENTPQSAGLNPWQLADQPLLAEILMLTDQEKWQQFVKNIATHIRSHP